jgi:hypothetical protein
MGGVFSTMIGGSLVNRRLAGFVWCVLALVAMASPGQADFTPYFAVAGGEPALDTILGSLYGVGNLVRVDDSLDQVWFNSNGHARARAKYAGYDQDFGFLKGTSGMAFTGMFQVTGGGFAPTVTSLNGFAPNAHGWYGYDHRLTGSCFRFADDTELTFSSRESDNAAGGNPSSRDHMITWRITGNGGGFSDNVLGNYVACWEDVSLGRADRDYNDLIVEFGGVGEIPEPGSVVLLGLVLAAGAAAGVRRRARRS